MGACGSESKASRLLQMTNALTLGSGRRSRTRLVTRTVEHKSHALLLGEPGTRARVVGLQRSKVVGDAVNKDTVVRV
jgi:hypothetical protein